MKEPSEIVERSMTTLSHHCTASEFICAIHEIMNISFMPATFLESFLEAETAFYSSYCRHQRKEITHSLYICEIPCCEREWQLRTHKRQQ